MRLTYVLLAKALLQTVALFAVLARSSRRDGAPSLGGAVGLAALVSAVTVGIEYALLPQAGWLVAIPALVACLLILGHYSWSCLLESMTVVLVLCAATVLLHWRADRLLRPPPEPVSAAAATPNTDVTRYQQVADGFRFAPETPLPTPATKPAVAPDTNTVAEPLPNPTNWPAAFQQLDIGGTMVLQSGRRVAFVNHRMMQEGNEVTAEYRGRIYRWRVRAVTPRGVEWDPVEVRDIPAAPAEPSPVNPAPAAPSGAADAPPAAEPLRDAVTAPP